MYLPSRTIDHKGSYENRLISEICGNVNVNWLELHMQAIVLSFQSEIELVANNTNCYELWEGEAQDASMCAAITSKPSSV